MRYIAATAIILGLGLPTFGSGPTRNEKSVPAAKTFDGVDVRKNVMMLPKLKARLATWELFTMALIPELALQRAKGWAEDRLIDWLYGIGKGRPGSIWQLLKQKILANPVRTELNCDNSSGGQHEGNSHSPVCRPIGPG